MQTMARLRLIGVAAVLTAVLSPVALADTAQPASPYAGSAARALRTLSDAQIADLLAGHGMGLAMAAELNHYPGPVHALELQGPLALSAAQLTAAEALRNAVKTESKALGQQIVGREQELDALFAAGTIDAARLRDLTDEIAGLWGRLRYAHLAAHLEMQRVLTSAQIAHYDMLRGYGITEPSAGRRHQHGD